MAVFLTVAAPASMRVRASLSSRRAAGCTPVQGGDAQQHVVAQAVGEVLEDLAGLVELQVHQDRGDDLRVLVLDEVGGGGGVHPFEALDAGGVAALQDARDQVGRLVVAQRLGQHRADVVVGIDMDRRVLLRHAQEFIEDAFHLGARHRLQGSHGMADFLHLARPEMLQHFRSMVLAQGDEQRGALLEAFFRTSCHLHPSNP